MVLNMEKVNGEALKIKNVTHMREIILMINAMAKEHSNGPAEMYTKDNIRMMKEVAMAK